MQREPGLGTDDTLLAVTTLSFDIAGLELLLPLISGARVIIAGREVAVDGARLSSLLKRCGATVMQATPATWQLLLAAGWTGSRGLKILCGGEAWPTGLANELLPRCESLWNMYGPTETTIWSSLARVEAGKPIVIGFPIANTTFYILDECRELVPVGVPGELYIGGDGVAEGYLNRPDLTAERFVSDPFGRKPGARLYRTGDIVRRLSDGGIEFLHRVDQQVKIRGFRIELGEIEDALRQHPAVQQAAVIAREDTLEDKRLVAYVVVNPRYQIGFFEAEPHSATAGSARGYSLFHSVESAGPAKPWSEYANTPLQNALAGTVMSGLSSHLRETLPHYMVPAAWVALPELPLSPNGKVDRKALPAPKGDAYAARGREPEQLAVSV